MLRILLFSILILTTGFGNVFAQEPILITSSVSMSELEFDGRWTHTSEWKQTTLDEFSYPDKTRIVLRSAHQGDFVYFFIDSVNDRYLDKKSDKAIICLDTLNDKTQIPNTDDYCFTTTLNGKHSYTLQGGSSLAVNSFFNKIDNHDDFIAISSVSNEHDRYSKIPHPSYEFKIPIDLIGRNSVYGIYVGVYDAHNKKVYSYPQNISVKNSFDIPSPSMWGEMISLDKSLPEFNIPITMMLLLIMTTIFLTRNKKILSLRI